MPAPAEIIQLIELFQRNYDQYRDPAFSEAAVRHQFIDPFFAALGWDVNNVQGFAEQYKEVRDASGCQNSDFRLESFGVRYSTKGPR